MRVVLDTNVLVRDSIPGTGSARGLFEFMVDPPAHVPVVPSFLLTELERVMCYERVRKLTRPGDAISNYLALLHSQDKGTLW